MQPPWRQVRSDISKGNEGKVIHQPICRCNIYFNRRQPEGNRKGKSSGPMDQHSSPNNKSQSSGRTWVHGKCDTILSSTSNISVREMLWPCIQQYLNPPTYAPMEGGRIIGRLTQHSARLHIHHGHTGIIFLLNPWQTHYILQSGNIRNCNPKESPTRQYHSPPSVISCSRPQGGSSYPPSVATPNRQHNWCHSYGHIFEILYLLFPWQRDGNPG